MSLAHQARIASLEDRVTKLETIVARLQSTLELSRAETAQCSAGGPVEVPEELRSAPSLTSGLTSSIGQAVRGALRRG